jgi:signal peptidase I
MNIDQDNPETPVEEKPPSSPAPMPTASMAGKVWYVAREIVITLVLFLLLRNLIVQARFIPSASMHPGLIERDRLLVEVVTTRFHWISRGDILVFYRPGDPKPTFRQLILSSFGLHDDHAMIKRVIGMPGDEVEVVAGEGVRINGELLNENYVAEIANDHFGPIRIPEGHYFMMGDNRNQSSDSRMWGFAPASNVIGRALVRFYPFDRVGLIR